MINQPEMKTGNGRSSTPNPDPTVLTTAQLIREITGLREQAVRENLALREIIEARLNGMDKAIELLRITTDQFPKFVVSTVHQLQELHEEKFDSVQVQFTERDTRTEQAAIATKIAVDAALQAQKEAAGAQNESNAAAITKSEAATAKQIDGILALVNSGFKALDEKIADLKGRLDRGEGQNSGKEGARTERQSSSSNTVALISLIAGIMIGIAGIAVAILAHVPK